MEHGEIACFGGCCYESVDERQSAMLPAPREQGLNLQSPPVVGVGDRHLSEGNDPVFESLVVVMISRRVPELENDGSTDGDPALSRERRESSSHRLLGQACEDACICEIVETWHSVVGSPRVIGSIEVVAAILAQHRD